MWLKLFVFIKRHLNVCLFFKVFVAVERGGSLCDRKTEEFHS